MNEPRPVATGEMTSTSMGALLCSLHTRKLSGSLVVAETEQRLHCVWLHSGLPSKIRLADQVDMTGELLTQIAGLPAEQIPRVMETATQGGILFGQAAEHLGLATRDDVRQALAQQVIRRGSRLFPVNAGTYGFYYENFLASFGGTDNPPVDPLPIIAAGVRTSYDLGRLSRYTAELKGKYITLSEGSGLAGRFLFNQQETAVVSALSSTSTLDGLARRCKCPPLIAHSVVYCLYLVDALEVADRAPSAVPARVTTSSVPAASNVPMDRRAEAEMLIQNYEIMDYYQLLGLDYTAEDADVQRAYIHRARSFHPDKATGELADLKPQLADVFAKISVAQQTLRDPKAREKYFSTLDLSSLEGEDGEEVELPPQVESEEETVQKILDAETTFQKARVLLRTRQLEEAHKLASAAAEANPEQGDYSALAAWIEAQQRPHSQDVTDLIAVLEESVKLAPRSENPNFYLAELYNRAGKKRKALDAYEMVMDINTHNIDAVRQVRLLRREAKQQAAKAKEKKGLLGALFKDIGRK